MWSPQLQSNPSVTGRRLRRIAMAVPVFAVAVTLAACSTGAGSPAKAASSVVSNSSGKGISIVIIGGPLSDPFFSVVKHGVDAATASVEAAGGKVTYLALANYNNQGADTAKLLQTALNQNPSAVIFPDWIPSAEEPEAKAIVQAGIPVIIYNSGTMANVKAVGALTYIGTDLYASGQAGGQEFVKDGEKNVVFVNTQPGDASAELTASGYRQALTSAGDKFSELNLPGSSFGSPTAVAQAVKSALLKDPTIDGVATYGAQDADSAYSAIQQAGDSGKVKLMGFNLSTNTLDRIKAGTQLGTVDQQGYAQGFYTVSAAFQYAAYGIDLATKPILTGPAVIDSSNVKKAISGTAAGVR